MNYYINGVLIEEYLGDEKIDEFHEFIEKNLHGDTLLN
jgi:hypothetical protein